MKMYSELREKTDEVFKRMTGISKEDFEKLLKKVSNLIKLQKKSNPLKQRGRKCSKLGLEDRVLLTLYYLRNYPTFLNLADVFNISEGYCHKIYTKYSSLMIEVEHLPNRKKLLEEEVETVIIDVSEQEIERPVKNQSDYYSGKKKRHTIKAQLLVCALSKAIYSVFVGKGRQHDFAMFKASGVLIHPLSKILGDSGYQGIKKYHENSEIPKKKPKGKSMSLKDKAYNKALSKKRILIENVNRRCKIFRIVKDVYRGKHKNYSLTWNLVAALVNLRYTTNAI